MKAIPKIEEFTANGFAVDWIRYAEALEVWADEQEAKYNALAKISDMQEQQVKDDALRIENLMEDVDSTERERQRQEKKIEELKEDWTFHIERAEEKIAKLKGALLEIQEHQIQTVQLARTTKVYLIAEEALK